MIKNLLEETITCLKENGKKESDVLWVGRDYYDHKKNKDFCYKNTWENFRKKANIMYDAGYGGNEIGLDLIVVGKDFWLERHEYDGSEWWEFKTMPTEPKKVMELDIKEYW